MSDIEKVEKLDETMMQSIMDGSISLKDFKFQKKEITERCQYIVQKMMQIQEVPYLDWWDFDNTGGQNGSSGFFDPDRYKESVWLNYEAPTCCQNFSILPYRDHFPTRWIWEDFEEECEREYQKAMQKWIKLKTDHNIHKEKRDKLKAQALKKLTPDERKALGLG